MNHLLEQNRNATLKTLSILVLIGLVSLVAVAQSSDVQTYSETVFHQFGGIPDGTSPETGLVRDNSGNLYGTTQYGGDANEICVANGGCGSLFELTPDGNGGYTYNLIYSLPGGNTGAAYPIALTIDGQGNLYALQSASVYEVSPASDGTWVLSNAYLFTGGVDGYNASSVIVDSSGNVYGTTKNGRDTSTYFGAIWKLTTINGQWFEQTLFGFACTKDCSTDQSGQYPQTLIMDKNGDLYGTTNLGGTLPGGTFGEGTVFKLHNTANNGWVLSTLHTFGGSNDGVRPFGNLVLDGVGNIYGTATYGTYPNQVNAVYKLNPSRQITWIYIPSDPSGNIGQGLVMDEAKNLYVSGAGNVFNQYCTPPSGCGGYYKLSPPSGQSTTWTASIVYGLDGGAGGSNPNGPLLVDNAGNLYGTAQCGGMDYGCSGAGVVFELTPNPVPTATTITKDGPNPSRVGQLVTVGFAVAQTVAGLSKPTGIVTVNASTGEGCISAVSVSGKASCFLEFLTAGVRTLTATYSGDSGNQSSVSGPVTQSALNSTTTTITRSYPDPAKVNHAVTVYFSVAAKTPAPHTKPTGTVIINASTGESCTGTLATDGDGFCRITFSSSGSRILVGTYSGDANNEGSVSITAAETVE